MAGREAAAERLFHTLTLELDIALHQTQGRLLSTERVHLVNGDAQARKANKGRCWPQ